ncbi:MAG: asparagine synthase-related protein [Enterocloster bolteae]
MVSDVPICTFLSGGVDSSLVSAICAKELKKQGKRLTTFSFDFVDNDKFFRANSFQPSQDRPYVDQMVKFLDSDHHYLECGNLTQADRLFDSVLAHDLPAMRGHRLLHAPVLLHGQGTQQGGPDRGMCRTKYSAATHGSTKRNALKPIPSRGPWTWPSEKPCWTTTS